MHPYLLLAGAIASELLGTTALKLSAGFSRPVPTVAVLAGYGLAFYLLGLTLEELPVGAVYATWAAVGIVGVAIIGVVAFDESVDVAGIGAIGLILAGVYVLNVVSDMSAH